MSFEPMQVGELARRTGVTVRTLHHYHEIGLLKPSLHTPGEYRRYTAADVGRLQQIVSLRQLGFSLEEIGDCLDRPHFAPLDVARRHLARLREQIALEQNLCERLEAIATHFQAAEDVSAEEFLQTIEATMLTEKYFTHEQQALIQTRREEIGEQALQAKQQEWAELIAAVRTEMEAGTDPSTPKVQALATRWREKVRETTGGDPEIEQSLKRLWDEQGDVLAAQHGSQYDPRPVFGYIGRAIESLGN